MGGHGGLNILPQKRWNVYRFDNREKVKKDEEAAAREEQLKREEARKRDAEFRLEKLRTARGLEPIIEPKTTESQSESNPLGNVVAEADGQGSQSNHINLFEGIEFFDIVGDEVKGQKRRFENDENDKKKKKMRKEEPPRAVTAEDEPYRLGYGVAGKGVKLPWYMLKSSDVGKEVDKKDADSSTMRKEKGKSNGKKTLEELREERLKREKREKERVQALLLEKSRRERDVARNSRYTRR